MADSSTRPRTPFEAWPLITARIPSSDQLLRDDASLGTVAPHQPAFTTPELAWCDFRANPAIRAADSATLVQSNGRPKLVLIYDVDIADKLRLQPRRQSQQSSRGKSR